MNHFFKSSNLKKNLVLGRIWMKRRKTEPGASEAELSDEQTKQNEVSSKNKPMLTIVALICLMVSAFVAHSLYTGSAIKYKIEYNQEYYDLTPDMILLYEKYDRNGNGKIDLNEFEPLAHRLLNYKVRSIFSSILIEF